MRAGFSAQRGKEPGQSTVGAYTRRGWRARLSWRWRSHRRVQSGQESLSSNSTRSSPPFSDQRTTATLAPSGASISQEAR